MLNKLLGLWRDAPVEIPDTLWRDAVATYPFMQRHAPHDLERLRALTSELLAQKEMSAAGGLELTAAIQVHIAAQACLPILNLGLSWYGGWSGIVVYPDEFVVARQVTDEDGVVHEYDEPIVGEAWDRGPLLLSWGDVQAGERPQRPQPYNVVIHEFTHKLDQLGGEADGVPPFTRASHPELDVRRWRDALGDAMGRLNAELELIEQRLPTGVDPDDDAAAPYYAHLPLDPYAVHDASEFFAVSSEAFFTDPARMSLAFPNWTHQLALFFKQQPLT